MRESNRAENREAKDLSVEPSMPQYTCPRCGQEYVLSPDQDFQPLCTNCQKRASAESYARLIAFGPKPIVTRMLIGANAAVYLLMVAAGVSWLEPSQWNSSASAPISAR